MGLCHVAGGLGPGEVPHTTGAAEAQAGVSVRAREPRVECPAGADAQGPAKLRIRKDGWSIYGSAIHSDFNCRDGSRNKRKMNRRFDKLRLYNRK